MQIITNLFSYNDTFRINKSCEVHNVTLASNMKNFALVGEEMNVKAVLQECFDEYHYNLENDMLLLNL